MLGSQRENTTDMRQSPISKYDPNPKVQGVKRENITDMRQPLIYDSTNDGGKSGDQECFKKNVQKYKKQEKGNSSG